MSETSAPALAAALVCAVHDNDHVTCHRILLDASQDELRAVAVVLAASVRDDEPLMAAWKPERPSYTAIVQRTCKVLGLGPDGFEDNRTFPYRRGRHVAAYVGHLFGYSQSEYGRLAGRNHTTIGSSIGKVVDSPDLLRAARFITTTLDPAVMEARTA